MISLPIILTIFLLLNYQIFDETNAMSIEEPPKLVSLETATCASIVSGLMDMQMSTMSNCAKTMTFKDGRDKAAKIACIGKCVAVTVGMLTKDGLLDRKTFDAFIVKKIPQRFATEILPLVNKCFDLGYGKLDPTEEYCESYSPFLKCFMRSLPNFCDNIKE